VNGLGCPSIRAVPQAVEAVFASCRRAIVCHLGGAIGAVITIGWTVAGVKDDWAIV
jgi:hypothetical protein